MMHWEDQPITQRSEKEKARTAPPDLLMMIGWNDLHLAAARGMSRKTQHLVSTGLIDINQRTGHGWTALMAAANAGHSRDVEILIKAGAIVSAGGGGAMGATALHLSSMSNRVAVTSILIHGGADVSARASRCGSMPLHLAAARGHCQILEVLVRGGANVDERRTYDGTTALFLAAHRSLEAVKTLLRLGANPLLKSHNGFIPLDAAVETGHVDIVTELVSAEREGEMITRLGIAETSLRVAAQNSNLEIMNVLYGAGARDKTGQALCAAVAHGCEEAVGLLLQHPEPVRPVNTGTPSVCGYVNYARASSHEGMSPLLCCLNHINPSSLKIMRRLIDAGADTTFTFSRVDGNRNFMYETTPLETVGRIIREQGLHGVNFNDQQVRWVEGMRKLLMQVPAIRSVSWGWVSTGAAGVSTTSTHPALLMPVRRERAENKSRVVTRALLR